MSER
ncbi:hypothetical protein BsWGS_07203 [Bradybaena similaris]|jgi:hypothetical protein